MLENYEEVPDRILRFYKDHPDGSLRCERMEFKDLPMEIAGVVEVRLHVIYHALAYRTPDDEKPGQGKASEPIPGLTNYTRGSEIMNAETSAWGRALAALGYVGKKGAGPPKVASANEVRARDEGGVTTGRPMASKAQVGFIEKLIKQKKVTDEQQSLIFKALGIPEGTELSELTGGKDGQASSLITFLKENPIPTGASDVPSDAGEFEQPELEGGDPTPFEEGS